MYAPVELTGEQVLLAFRHGFRAAELCDLRWDQVQFDAAVLTYFEQHLMSHP